MKFVSLVITTLVLTLGADAQTVTDKRERTTVVKQQKNTKGKKAGSSRTKSTAAKGTERIQLTDERSYRAKWTFEEMLNRYLEMNAKDAEAVTKQ